MVFYFQHLRPLYSDMKKERKQQEKFQFRINRVCFEVIFFIGSNPFELLIGAKEHNLAFVLKVWRGFKTELPDEIYYKICDILNLTYSEDHFSSKKFLTELDKAIPSHCSAYQVQPHEIAYYKKSDVPESEKIYFRGWNDHRADGRRAQNFEKTRKLLGDAVADFCEQHNISSIWTDKRGDRKDYFNPPGFP